MTGDTSNPAWASVPGSNTDGFIAARLPSWLKRASPSQIQTLRASFAEHQASKARLHALTLDLLPLQAFAERHFQTLLTSPLPAGVQFSQLEWLVVTPRVESIGGHALEVYRYGETRRNGLLQLMGNFEQGTSYYLGTGLVAPGDDRVLSGDTDTLVRDCRALDVGGKYQALLERVFTSATQAILADHKRSGLRLASEFAALRGDIDAQVQRALREVADVEKDLLHHGLRGYPGALQMLGQTVADGMYIRLRDKQGEQKGIVLYLPSDPERALRVFADEAAMNAEMGILLQGDGYRHYFSQLISLQHRPMFIHTLRKRLSDPLPDLELKGQVHDQIFTQMARQQVQRVKDDARLVLVPSADFDKLSARNRREAWKDAGLDLANLAGFFIPVVGVILLGRLVIQTLGECFEGAADWYEGHQHEALEHLLNIAATVAAVGATSVVVSGVRSAFVDALEPVSLGPAGKRLWSTDLKAYQSLPERFGQRPDGLYGDGERRWVRIERCYYEVHRPDPWGPYRLRHPTREAAYGPVVLHNEERGWRLQRARPQDWDDPVQMLDSLWPQHPRIDQATAQQVLQVAGLDLDELRAVLVENRMTPVNLRVTLQRFEADARIRRFFAHVQTRTLADEDLPLLSWCEAQPGVGSGIDNVLKRKAALLEPLHAHLSQPAPIAAGVEALLARDMPGLAPPYSQTLARQATEAQRRAALEQGKLPVQIGLQARALLRVARLDRMLAGLYLPSAYVDESGVLALTLLEQLEGSSINLGLCRQRLDDHPLKAIGSGGDNLSRRVLVREDGQFHLYDGDGFELGLVLDEPGNLFEAIHGALSSTQLIGLGLTRDTSAGALRALLLQQLPATRGGIAQMLGWPEAPAWFNPGQRLDDGRVGYLLSDHPVLPRTPSLRLREHLERYFPGLRGRLDEELARRMHGRDNAFEVVGEIEDDQQQFERALNSWVGVNLNAAGRNTRQLLAERLRLAWRVQARDIVDTRGNWQGQSLDVDNLAINTLPSFPLQLDFSHVTSLRLRGAPISHVGEGFLNAFGALRELDLSENQLLEFPATIGYLTRLQTLKLASNRMRLSARAMQVLYTLPQLSVLDLSRNPLGQFSLRFSHLSQLVTLRLRDTGLQAWPEGLELCGFLDLCDLRDNRMQAVPARILEMPLAFRRAFLVNHLDQGGVDWLRLYQLDPIAEEPPEGSELDPQASRSWWVGEGAREDAERARRWDALLVSRGGIELTRLFGRLAAAADFVWPRESMREQGWALLLDINADDALRSRVYQLAGEQPGAGNAAADCFSRMQVARRVAEAGRSVQPDQGETLLQLGRSLFRLDQLERIAQRDIGQRQARGEVVDELAIRLAYRVRLRDQLKLVGQPVGVHLGAGSSVSDAQLTSARQRVAQAERSDAFLHDLSRRPFWISLLREHYPRYFASRPLYYLELRENIMEQRQAALVSELRIDHRRAIERFYESKLKQVDEFENRDQAADGGRPLPLHLTLRLLGELRSAQG